MTATLHPMNLGEILDKTFQIYRAKFLVFAGIAALPALATAAVQFTSYFLWGTYPQGWLDVGFGLTTAELGSKLGFYHFSLFFQLLIWPCIAYGTSLSYSSELSTLTLRSALRAGFVGWRGLLGLAALLLLFTLLVPEVICSAVFLAFTYVCSEVLKFNANQMDIVLTPATPLACIAGWVGIGWMSAMLGCTIPGRTIEALPVIKSIRRGWRLSKGSRARILIAWLMPAIVGWVLVFIVSRVITLLMPSCASDPSSIIQYQSKAIGAFMESSGWCASPFSAEWLRIVSEAAIYTVLGPIYPIAVTLFYYDQRIRLEGYDIECMMKAAGLDGVAVEEKRESLGSATVAQDVLVNGEGQA
jgi:hypothetical protein